MVTDDVPKRDYGVFTREELYELVWSETFTNLTKRFGVSHSKIAKLCEAQRIPTPGRGHWGISADLRNANRVPLGPRPPASACKIRLGEIPSRHFDETVPEPPSFDEELSSVKARMLKAVSNLSAEVSLANPAPKIAQYLRSDEGRRNYEGTPLEKFFGPKFQQGIGRRRLAILNWLSKATTKLDCRLSVTGTDAENIVLRVGMVSLDLTLTTDSKEEHLRLAVRSRWSTKPPSTQWTDGARKLEQQLPSILAELLVIAEQQYRAEQVRHHEWEIAERKRRQEQAVKDEKEQQKREAERLKTEAAARIEQLRSEASTLRLANDIRQYVAAVQQRTAPSEALSTWAEWALREADSIDPVLIGIWQRSSASCEVARIDV